MLKLLFVDAMNNYNSKSNSPASAVQVEANLQEQLSDYLLCNFELENVGQGCRVRLSKRFDSTANISYKGRV